MAKPLPFDPNAPDPKRPYRLEYELEPGRVIVCWFPRPRYTTREAREMLRALTGHVLGRN